MIKYMDPQICIHACALLYKLLVSSSSSSCSLYKLPESSSCTPLAAVHSVLSMSASFPKQRRISASRFCGSLAARGHLPASLVSIVRIVLPVYESVQVPYHGSCHRHSYCYRGGSCCPALAYKSTCPEPPVLRRGTPVKVARVAEALVWNMPRIPSTNPPFGHKALVPLPDRLLRWFL